MFIHSKTRKSTFKIVGNILRMNKLYSKKTNIKMKIINLRNRLNKNLKLVYEQTHQVIESRNSVVLKGWFAPPGAILDANDFLAEQPPGLDYSKCLCVGRTSFTKVQEQPSNIMPFLFRKWRKKISFGFTHRESWRERERAK